MSSGRVNHMVDDSFVLQSLLLCGFQHSVSTDCMSIEVCVCDRRWMILLVEECMSVYDAVSLSLLLCVLL